jgi:hypothetical protein
MLGQKAGAVGYGSQVLRRVGHVALLLLPPPALPDQAESMPSRGCQELLMHSPEMPAVDAKSC